MDNLQNIIVAFELHAAADIKLGFENGINPNQIYNGKPLVYELINMYTRGPHFKSCIKAFVDNGLVFDDAPLLAVLMDDSVLLEKLLLNDKTIMAKQYFLDGAFTPLYKVTLLHICAEYNHTDCAQVLIKYGADVNAKAGLDEHGFGGHTPIFHTVNQNNNKCIEAMQLLINHDANLAITIKGLVWGKTYTWETFVPAVNPISYAMMGLLPQFQRLEKDIYDIINILIKARWGTEYYPNNIPNKYLAS